MKAQKVVVEVGHTGDNYSAHIAILPGCIATANTFFELKRNMEESIKLHISGMKEDDEQIPVIFENFELAYKPSTEALLNIYSSVFTKAALSRLTGINERQLWHYAAGLRKPRPAQTKRIEDGLHKLGKELLEITL